jgi:hypothetical protein
MMLLLFFEVLMLVGELATLGVFLHNELRKGVNE